MDKFHEETMVHVLKVFNPKTAMFLGCADSVPGNEALGAAAVRVTSPKEGTAFGVKQDTHTFGEKNRGHMVDW